MTISTRHHINEWGLAVPGGYYGTRVRRDRDQFKAHVAHDCYSTGSVEGFITSVREAAEGLTDATIHVSGGTTRDRDEEWANVEVHGDRPATPEEIEAFLVMERENADYDTAKAEWEATKANEAKVRANQAALARAREAFPDQFKETT